MERLDIKPIPQAHEELDHELKFPDEDPAQEVPAFVIQGFLNYITGCPQSEFENLSQKELQVLLPIAMQISENEGLINSVIRSDEPEKMNYLRFSRKKFDLPNTISMFYSELLDKWIVIEHLHGRESFLSEGSFKVIKTSKLGDYVRGRFYNADEEEQEESVAIHRDLLGEFHKLTPEERNYLCFAELVSYKSNSSGKRKWMFFAPRMDGELETMISEVAPKDVPNIVKKILVGINGLHRLGYAHLDLRPPNVLLKMRNGEWIPKIIDYDLTRLVDTQDPDDLAQAFDVSCVGGLIQLILQSVSRNNPNDEIPESEFLRGLVERMRNPDLRSRPTIASLLAEMNQLF